MEISLHNVESVLRATKEPLSASEILSFLGKEATKENSFILDSLCKYSVNVNHRYRVTANGISSVYEYHVDVANAKQAVQL